MHRTVPTTRPGSVAKAVATCVSAPVASSQCQLRETEVEDLDVSVSGEKQVLGLEILVHDPASVRGDEPSRHLAGDLHGLAFGNRASREPAAQLLALQPL